MRIIRSQESYSRMKFIFLQLFSLICLVAINETNYGVSDVFKYKSVIYFLAFFSYIHCPKRFLCKKIFQILPMMCLSKNLI